MTFHLPGNDSSVIVSNADLPFSSCVVEAGLDAHDLEPLELLTDCFHADFLCVVDVNENDSKDKGNALIMQIVIIYHYDK